MSAVINLQKNIIGNKKTLTELLREAMLISSKLKLNDFKIWISNELKGYENENVPSYRILKTELKFFNPYHGWQSPTINNIKTDNTINTQHIQQSIVELEDLSLNSPKDYRFSLLISDYRKKELMDYFNTDQQPSLVVNKLKIIGIVEQVKTRLLEWLIELESNGILGDENMKFSNEEQSKAQKNIHIENFSGIMGDIENLGNLSNGDSSHNIATINNDIKLKLDDLIKKINNLDIDDNKEVIEKINDNREDKGKLTKILGQLMTRGSEIATIAPAIGALLGLLG